jgi:hypothetical protein
MLAALWTKRLNFSVGKEIIVGESEQGGWPRKGHRYVEGREVAYK